MQVLVFHDQFKLPESWVNLRGAVRDGFVSRSAGQPHDVHCCFWCQLNCNRRLQPILYSNSHPT